MKAIRITVDPQKCEHSGYCERIAGRVFTLGNDGTPARVLQAIVSDPETIKLILEAEPTCPGRAIELEEFEC